MCKANCNRVFIAASSFLGSHASKASCHFSVFDRCSCSFPSKDVFLPNFKETEQLCGVIILQCGELAFSFCVFKSCNESKQSYQAPASCCLANSAQKNPLEFRLRRRQLGLGTAISKKERQLGVESCGGAKNDVEPS